MRVCKNVLLVLIDPGLRTYYTELWFYRIFCETSLIIYITFLSNCVAAKRFREFLMKLLKYLSDNVSSLILYCAILAILRSFVRFFDSLLPKRHIINGRQIVSGTYQSLSRQNLEELDKVLAISHVHVQVADTASYADEVRVHPFLKRLLLHAFSFVWGIKTGFILAFI